MRGDEVTFVFCRLLFLLFLLLRDLVLVFMLMLALVFLYGIHLAAADIVNKMETKDLLMSD
jgi:hypothetical protein